MNVISLVQAEPIESFIVILAIMVTGYDRQERRDRRLA